MRCPFLHETRVKYCSASGYRKPIAEVAIFAESDRCSSPDYVNCAAAGSSQGEPSTRCPSLCEVDSEFCDAAAITKYLPTNAEVPSRCRSEGHVYCDLFVAFADPQRILRQGLRNMIEQVQAPERLLYSPNHMWIDIAEDGYCHIGIDAFLANAVGDIDKVAFAVNSTSARPAVVLSVGDADLNLVFPKPMDRVTPNHFLRVEPHRITSEPYGAGWLFEGLPTASEGGRPGETFRDGLISGHVVGSWMKKENARLSRFTHDHLPKGLPGGGRTMADGGVLEHGFARLFNREDRIIFFNAFFASF